MTSATSNSTLVPAFRSGFSPLLKAIAYPLGQFVLPIFFKNIRVSGQEHIPQSGATILAPTHRSRWDSMLIPYVAGPYVTGRDVRFMTSADEMLGVQGWLVRRLGGFPVDTKNPSVASFRFAIDLLNQGELLAIYPEGNIFRDGDLHPLKKGLARIALQAHSARPEQEITILPISLRYSQPVPTFKDSVSIIIEPPLRVSQYAAKSVKAAAEGLHNDLTAAMARSIEANAATQICS
jgi:1-acyl-sn-glycerol-3-phosphate acyltransferase